MSFAELRAEHQRQLIDTVEIFEAWRAANIERRRRFVGSMRWVDRSGKQYLLRKIGSRERSLGARNPETEAAHTTFQKGRERNRDLLAGLATRLDEMAPVNKAMGLGRVPSMPARILRDLDERELLGHQLFLVGTNAIFAYEARAGVRVASELLATGDVDLLFDNRPRLSLVGREVRNVGLLGILQRLDHSFSLVRKGGFRAINRDGYLVDLIRPEACDPMRDNMPDALSSLPDELHGSPIWGLSWLINAPRFAGAAIAEDGYPVYLVCIDPRVFALHKLWIAQDIKRDPRKRTRDLAQAKTCAAIASLRLGLSFEETSALSALPVSLRELRSAPLDRPSEEDGEGSEPRLRPRW